MLATAFAPRLRLVNSYNRLKRGSRTFWFLTELIEVVDEVRSTEEYSLGTIEPDTCGVARGPQSGAVLLAFGSSTATTD